MDSRVFLTDVSDQRSSTSCPNAVFCPLNGNANLPLDLLALCQVYISGIKEALHLSAAAPTFTLHETRGTGFISDPVH